MGPSRISLRDEAINILEAQLEAHKAKISLLQQKLVSALDTLDHVQAQHSLELDSEVQRRRHAEAKLRRYMDTVQAAEIERDDLRDAVMKLVMKVESGNDDFSSWPRSQMHVSGFLDPAVPINEHRTDKAASKDGSEDQLLSYAGAIIASLRHERDLARVAHAQSCEMYEERIHTLEAQLARRDAELEAREEHVGHVVLEANLTSGKEMHKKKGYGKEPAPMEQEEVMTMLQRTTARNKTLEGEIKNLFKRLEEARTARSTASPSQSLPSQPSPEHDHLESRAEGNPGWSHDHGSPLAFPDPLAADNSVVDPQFSHDILDPSGAKEKSGHDNISPRQYHQTAEHLNKQIAELSATIDAFKAERDALRGIITSRRHVQDYSSELESEPEIERTTIQAHATFEDESISLRHAIRQLEEELYEANMKAKVREKELLNHIEHMWRASALADTATNADDLTVTQEDLIPKTDNLLDAYDGEMSMDLATPLFPISLLPSSPPPQSRPQSRSARSQTQSPRPRSTPNSSEGEGSQIPRMIRPRILSSPSPSLTQSPSSTPPPSSPSPLPLNASQLTFVQDFPSSPALQSVSLPLADPMPAVSMPSANIEQVERELAAERFRLQEGEQQLAELQNVLHDLHEQQRMSRVV